MRHLSLAAIAVALSVSLAARAESRNFASADNTTPLPTTPTPGITAVVEPSVTPAVIVSPTVVQERPSADPTSPEGFPTPIATNTPIPENPGSVGAQPAQTPAVLVAPVPSVSGPTPSQLRQDALLRWGDRIPVSVHRWAFLIVPAARKYGVDPNLVAAVMTMESNGDPMAESPADAHGLMQILHGPWNPKLNVYAGVRMLAELYTEFGSWPLALAGYNAGPAAVAGANGIPPIQETRDYVVVVTYLWDLYGHHSLSGKRRKQYQATLRDLAKFKDQRKRVRRLARAADLPLGMIALCRNSACTAPGASVATTQLDPFWPDASVPDPLQHVSPFPSASRG